MKAKMSLMTRFIWFLALITPSLAHPQLPSSGPSSPGQADIKILSEQMECDQSRNVCVAKGNAIAQKLDGPKTKILKADQITTHFAREGETGPVKLTRLEAEGNVFFIIDDIIIQGKRGNYLADSEVAEVFGDVKITNGKNQLDGSYGKVYMKTGHYSIKRDGEPVQALIFTAEK